MQNLVQKRGWLASTIGRKQLIGVTGLGLSLFVLTHMLGNLLIFVGPQTYNEYGHALVSNPLIYVAEAGLLAMFIAHLGLATKLAFENRGARNDRYFVKSNGAKGTSAVQRSLWAQGLVILVFTVYHLITFKFGPHYTVDYGKGEIRDLHRLVIEVFQNPAYVGGYLFALAILGFHLAHGIGSSFQTLGLHHPRYQKGIKMISLFYALAVALGFISQPLYVYFIH